MSLASNPESTPFFIITENSYGCELGKVSATAKLLGATLLVIAPNTREDMTRYVDWSGGEDTVPTVIAHPDFMYIALDYFPTDEMVFKVDYTLAKNTQVDYTIFMISNPPFDAQIA